MDSSLKRAAIVGGRMPPNANRTDYILCERGKTVQGWMRSRG
jgi:hypothetical protein